MNEKNTKNIEQFDEQDKKLYEAFVELGWITPETDIISNDFDGDDDDCFPFPSELEDPMVILERIKNRDAKESKSVGGKLEQLTKETPAAEQKLNNRNSIALDLAPNLLAFVRLATGYTASNIAQKLEVTVPFLRGCGDHSESVPTRCKQELISRTCRAFAFLDSNKVRQVVESPPKQAVTAGFRDTGYSGKKMTFQEIVEKSGLSELARKFWLELAAEE